MTKRSWANMPTEPPREIKIRYDDSVGQGLLRGFSDDLPGLSAFGQSKDEVNRKLADVCSAFMYRVYGSRVQYGVSARGSAADEALLELA